MILTGNGISLAIKNDTMKDFLSIYNILFRKNSSLHYDIYVQLSEDLFNKMLTIAFLES